MNKLNTTFIITGGAGRVINSIPALEKYERLNPNDDFKVIVHGWESVFWSHPTLQKRVFGAHQKGNFDNIIRNSKTVSPEPYQNYRFYNQQVNLIEAFDEEINHTQDHSDLNYNCLHLSEYEIAKSKELVEKYKTDKKKRKVIVFQPFGSTVEIVDKKPIDRSNRSFELKDYFKIVQSVSNDVVILYASLPQFRHPSDTFSISFDEIQPYHRTLMSLIYHCDYFVGCCSVGQHVARAFDKPGLIIMGATNETNFSYPNHFDIYRKKDREPKYTPWRLSEVDCEFSDRENEGLMKFDDKEINKMIQIIKKNIGSSTIEKIGDTEMKYD
jgi:hypothetical protein